MSAADSKSKAADTATAATDAALAAALKENAKLKKRLAKLQRIENGLEADPARGVTIEKDVCLSAFNDFDVDKSGYIDKSELSLLATDLGAALDDRELESAYKQIDTSGDGKIQFEEFFRWWNGQGGMQGAEKDIMKLTLLRARLLSFKGKKVMDALAASAKKAGLVKPDGKSAAPAPAASASGSGKPAAAAADSKDTKDSKSSGDSKEPEVAAPAGSHSHTIRLSVGDFEKAAMRLSASLKQGWIGDPKILNGVDPAKTGLFVSVDIKSQGKPDFIDYLSALAQTWSRVLAKHSIVLSACAPPNTKDIARVTIGLPIPVADPAQMFKAIGLPLESITRLASLNLEFGHSLAEIFDFSKSGTGEGLSFFDIFCFRAALKIVADPDLLNTLRHLPIEPVVQNMASAAARAKNKHKTQFVSLVAPVLSNLDTASNFVFGDTRSLFQFLLDNDPNMKKDSRIGLEMGVSPFAPFIEAKLKASIAADARNEMRIGFSAFRGMALTLARDFNEIVGVSVWSPSGLAAEVKLDGIIVLSQIVEAFTALEQIIATVPLNPGGIPGQAPPRQPHRRY